MILWKLPGKSCTILATYKKNPSKLEVVDILFTILATYKNNPSKLEVVDILLRLLSFNTENLTRPFLSTGADCNVKKNPAVFKLPDKLDLFAKSGESTRKLSK